MIENLEEQAFQARIFGELTRCFASRRIPVEQVAVELSITVEAWQRLLNGVDSITAYQLYKCAELVGTSYHYLLPDSGILKSDLLMAMARSLPLDLFEELSQEAARLLQKSAHRSNILPSC